MALEVAGTILDLNENWPLGTDPLAQGDDHIRLLKTVLQAAYPIGSVLYNTTGANPGTYIGGTWVAYAEGRAIVGVGGTWTGGEERGSETHTLTAGEMPGHTHSFSGTTGGATAAILTSQGRTTAQVSTPGTFPENQTHTHSFSGTTGGAGSGGAHNNVQPSIGTYAWVRTA